MRALLNLQVCGLSVGPEGYLRWSTLSDLTPACRADRGCRAAGLAQLRIDYTKLVDGLHPTRTGVPACEADAAYRTSNTGTSIQRCVVGMTRLLRALLSGAACNCLAARACVLQSLHGHSRVLRVACEARDSKAALHWYTHTVDA